MRSVSIILLATLVGINLSGFIVNGSGMLLLTTITASIALAILLLQEY